MNKIYKFVGGRKFLLVILAIGAAHLNPEASTKELVAVFGIPGLFVLVEGIRDIIAAWKEKK